MRLGHVAHWTPGLAGTGLLFPLRSGTGRRLRAPPTTCHTSDLGPQGHLRNEAVEPPLWARPGFGWARGFVKARVPSSQLVLVLVLVRILVQDLVILVLDV